MRVGTLRHQKLEADVCLKSRMWKNRMCGSVRGSRKSLQTIIKRSFETVCSICDMYYFVKRLLDIVLSIVLLPLFLVTTLVIAPMIYIEDKGSIFYISTRIGKACKVFRMYKFRSMIMDAEIIYNSDGSTFNTPNDKRLTRIGRFIRKTSIDELPQIFNVMKGDMSFIGPRPCLTEQLTSYSADEKEKYNVLPGITGYTQSYFRNRLDPHEERQKDIWYVRNASLFLDIKILIHTVMILFRLENVYRNITANQPCETEKQ